MPEHPEADDAWAQIGEIVGVFGVKGELKVRPLSDFAERFAVGAQIFLGDARQPHTITSARLRPGSHILALSGIDNMTDAERLRGQLLWTPATTLMPLSADQFYQHDIVGLRVERVNGKLLGVIVDIIPGGQHDLYVIRDESTDTEHLLPAVKEFIKQVDIAGGVIRVEPIPGLFDDDSETTG